MTTSLLPAQRAQSWLAGQKLSLDQLAVLQRTRLHVRGVERVEPGYADELRAAALAAIAGSDLALARNGITVLAAIGQADAVAPLRRLLDSDSPFEADARRAIAEIENREARGEDPLAMLEITPAREVAGRVVVGVLGGAGVTTMTITLLSQLTHGRTPFLVILGGVGSLLFATWMVKFAWTGKK